MKISSQDQPKAILLGLGILVCIGVIGSTVVKSTSAKKDEAKPSPLLAGNPQQVAALEPEQDPMQYVRNIERWSQPPMAPAGDPFREVLPRYVAQSLREGIQTRPATQITGSGFGGGAAVDPMLPNPTAAIDFPEIRVQGVVADEATGSSYAVLFLNNQVRYAKPGEVIEKGLKVDKVSELGIWIWAGKEHAFIEVSKSYKPNGMAPPAPAASRRRR
jgi:hypothetical protein